MMDTHIQTLARQGLDASAQRHLRFWKDDALNTEAAEAALDTIEKAAGADDGAVHAVALARAAAATQSGAATRLDVLREGLALLSAGASGGVGGAASMAVRLLQALDHETLRVIDDARVEPAARALLGETARIAQGTPLQATLTFARALETAGADSGALLQHVATLSAPPTAAGLAALALDVKATGESTSATQADAVRALHGRIHASALTQLETLRNAVPADATASAQLDRWQALTGCSLGDATTATSVLTQLAHGDAADAAGALAVYKASPSDASAQWALAETAKQTWPDGSPEKTWLTLRAALPGGHPAVDRAVADALADHHPPTPDHVFPLAAALVRERPADVATVLDALQPLADDRTRAGVAFLRTLGTSAPALVACALQSEAVTAPGPHPDPSPLGVVARALGTLAAPAHVPPAEVIAVTRVLATHLETDSNEDVRVKGRFLRLPLFGASTPAAQQATALAEGVRSMAALRTLSTVATLMAAQTDVVADKARIGTLALAQIEQGLRAHDSARLPFVAALSRCAAIEDDAMRAAPNRLWFRAANALAALRLVDHPADDGTDGLATAALALLDTPWASREWDLAVGAVMTDAIVAAHPADMFATTLVNELHGHLQDPNASPEALLTSLRETVQTLAQRGQDPMHRALAGALNGPAEDAPRVEDQDCFIVVGGVRVPKADGGPLPQVTPVASPTPGAAPPHDPLLALDVPDPTIGLAVHPETTETKFDTSYLDGVAGVFNPLSGEIEWKTSYKDGVAGVFNPYTRQVEWNASYMDGVGGAWNPRTGTVVWETSYKDGVALVFNPDSGKIESQRSYLDGVFGVFNPRTRAVTFKSSYKDGVGGVFDVKQGVVRFKTSYKDGVAGVSTDPEWPTLSSGSVAWDDD